EPQAYAPQAGMYLRAFAFEIISCKKRPRIFGAVGYRYLLVVLQAHLRPGIEPVRICRRHRLFVIEPFAWGNAVQHRLVIGITRPIKRIEPGYRIRVLALVDRSPPKSLPELLGTHHLDFVEVCRRTDPTTV